LVVGIVLGIMAMSVACQPAETTGEPEGVAPWNQRTATPRPVLGIMQHSLGLEVMPSPTPSPVPTATPTPTALPPAKPSSIAVSAAGYSGGGAEQWRSTVAQYFPAESVDTVLRIMECESHGNPLANNGVHQGLMQENVNYHLPKAIALFGPGADLYDPVTNIAVAAVISGGYNFGAWSCQ
jgi:hypothetical protein